MNKNEKLEFIDSCYEKELLTDEYFKNIQELCQDKDAEVRMRVSELLGAFLSERTENILLTMLDDSDYLVRATVCDALSSSNSLDVLHHLMRLVRDKRVIVRGYAVLSVADVKRNIKVNTENIVAFLEERLRSEKSNWVRIALYRSLILLGKISYTTVFLEQIEARQYRLRIFTLSLLDELLDENVMKMTEELNAFLKNRYFLEESYAVKCKLFCIMDKY